LFHLHQLRPPRRYALEIRVGTAVRSGSRGSGWILHLKQGGV